MTISKTLMSSNTSLPLTSSAPTQNNPWTLLPYWPPWCLLPWPIIMPPIAVKRIYPIYMYSTIVVWSRSLFLLTHLVPPPTNLTTSYHSFFIPASYSSYLLTIWHQLNKIFLMESNLNHQSSRATSTNTRGILSHFGVLAYLPHFCPSLPLRKEGWMAGSGSVPLILDPQISDPKLEDPRVHICRQSQSWRSEISPTF